jgi:hypothetical protein
MSTAAPPARRRPSAHLDFFAPPVIAPGGPDRLAAVAVIRPRVKEIWNRRSDFEPFSDEYATWLAETRIPATCVADSELERFAQVLATTRSRRELEAWLALILTPKFWNAQLVAAEMNERRHAKDAQIRQRTTATRAPEPTIPVPAPRVQQDRGGSSRPAQRTAGRRASVGDGNGGSSGESDPGGPSPGGASETRHRGPNVSQSTAPAKWDEHELPTDGAASQALRSAFQGLLVQARDWDVPLHAAVQIDSLDSLRHECRRRDFGPTIRADRAEAEDRIADAISAVNAWRDETVRRLRWVRYGIHEAPRRSRSAA